MVTPLWHSLQELCRSQIVADDEFLRVAGLKPCGTFDVDDAVFSEYRRFKLRQTIQHASLKSRFYSRTLAGFDPEQIHDFGDLSALPFTTPADLAADPYAFLCVSQSVVDRAITFTSSGTVGPQKRVFFASDEIESIIDFMAAGMRTVADASDVVQILLPEGPALGQSDLLARGVSRMGARAVVSGMFISPRKQIECIRANSSTVLFGESHLLYRITKVMEEVCDLGSLGVKVIFTATSHTSPAMREYLERAWQARVSTHYGLTEMGLGFAVDCPVCEVRHFNALDVVAEVVDPDTGESLPAGSMGELVLTTLGRRAMPLIRYRTRDLATLGIADAACPSFPLAALGPVERRVRSEVALSMGGAVCPTTFHETLFRVPEVVDYEVSVAGSAQGDVLEFDIEVLGESLGLRERLVAALRRQLQESGVALSPHGLVVRFHALGDLSQGVQFKKIVRDTRATSET